MTDLLAQETALLRGQPATRDRHLQEEKTRLSYSYARDYGLLKANARFVGARVPTQVDRLRRGLKVLCRPKFRRTLPRSRPAKAVSQGLLNAIYEIAKSKTSGPSCYTNAASMAVHSPAKPTALTVDRSL